MSETQVQPELPDLLVVKGPNLVQKEPNSKTRGQKKGQPLFPNLSAVTKPYEPTLNNLLNANLPQDFTIVAQQQNKYVMKDRKRTT